MNGVQNNGVKDGCHVIAAAYKIISKTSNLVSCTYQLKCIYKNTQNYSVKLFLVTFNNKICSSAKSKAIEDTDFYLHEQNNINTCSYCFIHSLCNILSTHESTMKC